MTVKHRHLIGCHLVVLRVEHCIVGDGVYGPYALGGHFIRYTIQVLVDTNIVSPYTEAAECGEDRSRGG